MDYLEFRREVLGLNRTRKHKIRNSYGVYDAYKYYRRTKPKESKYVLTESQYFAIIRAVNLQLKDNLLQSKDVVLPSRMGSLELRKRAPSTKIVDGKLVSSLPIDWDRTLRLWAEDEEAYTDRVLIRLEEKEVFSILYNKKNCNYNNKTFYQFNVNKSLRQELKKLIKQHEIDAFDLWQNNNKA